MIIISIFSTVEFYVIMAVIAAAIVAFASRPKARGEMQEFLIGSTLYAETSEDKEAEPSVEFRCLPNGKVKLIRTGLTGIFMSGAVSAAVKSDGYNVVFEERLVQGSSWSEPAQQAMFHIDFLSPGRYHIRYHSRKSGLFVAFQLHVTPGIVATRILSR